MGMDPGVLALMTLFTTPIGCYVIAKSGVVAAIQHVMGHNRGEFNGYLSALFYGGLVGGGTLTAPLWVPRMVAAVSAIQF